MKKFSFSMQKILDLREFEQKEAEAELGKANAEVARIQRELEAVAKSRASVTKDCDSCLENFSFYAQTEKYFIFLEQKQESLLEELAQAELVAEEKRAVVRKAMQNVKVLEKLKENKFAQWKKDRLQEEELAVDDVVSAAYN